MWFHKEADGPWRFAALTECHSIFFLKHYQSSLISACYPEEELGGWISQNSSQHQIDDPLIIHATDNRQWSQSRICKVLSGAELRVVWSVPFNHVRMFVSQPQQTAQKISSTPVLALTQQHRQCWTRWKDKLHNQLKLWEFTARMNNNDVR